MINIATLTDNYVGHANADFVSLWQIAERVKEECASQEGADVIGVTLRIAQNMMNNNIDPGDYTSSGFSKWSGTTEERTRRIKNAWLSLGRDPSLADPICWFARLS